MCLQDANVVAVHTTAGYNPGSHSTNVGCWSAFKVKKSDVTLSHVHHFS